MAKRYTDQSKWGDDWFIDLPPNMKIAWFYLCDNCSWGGFWKVSKRIYEVHTGCSFDAEGILSAMCGRVVDIGDGIWHIPSFIKFQQGELKAGSRFHDSILAEIEKYLGSNKTLFSPLQAPPEGLCNGNGNGNGNNNIILEESEGSVRGGIPTATDLDLWKLRHMEFLTSGHPSWLGYEVPSYRQWCLLPSTSPQTTTDEVIIGAVNYMAYTTRLKTNSRYVKKPQNFLAEGAWAIDWENIDKKQVEHFISAERQKEINDAF